MKYTKYPELKSELKQLAKEIKELKYKRDHWYDFGNDQSWFMFDAFKKGREFRHKHIAYCMLNGTEYHNIEQPREDNKPDMVHVQLLMERYDKKEIKFRTVLHA